MTFVHLADTHLGMTAFQAVDPESGMNLRERLIYDNFLASVEEIIRARPDAVVHAGDLFDQVRPRTRAYTTVLTALDRLHDEDIPLVVIAGNHSMPKTRYTESPFAVLDYHRADIHAAYRYRYEPVECGDTLFHLIPNLLRPEHYSEEFNRVECSPRHHNVLVTHGLASDLSDKKLQTAAEHEISMSMLSSDFEYIALGHYHGQQQVADNAWYSGSIEYCSYREIGDRKGGLVVDPGTRTVAHLGLPHTPMVDAGTIDCANLTPAGVIGEVGGLVERLAGEERTGMCRVTLTGLTRETARHLNRRELAAVKGDLLDLRIRIIRDEQDTPVLDAESVERIDYVDEFSSYVERLNLPPRQQQFVRERGAEILRRVLKNRQEARDAAE
ncbi:MAG: metallophosphoesterase family protein [Methanomicrobiales archaeon]